MNGKKQQRIAERKQANQGTSQTISLVGLTVSFICENRTLEPAGPLAMQAYSNATVVATESSGSKVTVRVLCHH
jgi:hypothetical protein